MERLRCAESKLYSLCYLRQFFFFGIFTGPLTIGLYSCFFLNPYSLTLYSILIFAGGNFFRGVDRRSCRGVRGEDC